MSGMGLSLLVLGLVMGFVLCAVYLLSKSILALAQAVQCTAEKVDALEERLLTLERSQQHLAPDALVKRDERRVELLRSLLSFTMGSQASAGKETSWPA